MNFFKQNKFNKKDGLLIVLSPIFFLIIGFITMFILVISGIINNDVKMPDIILFTLVIQALYQIIFSSFYFKEIIKNNYQHFKTNWRINLKYIILGIILMFGLDLLVYLIFKPSVPENQKIVEEFFKLNPILMAINVVLIGPIFEEIVFRLILFNHLGNRFNYKLSFTVSTLLFAAMHVEFSEGISVFLAYFIGSCVLPLMYYKSKNLFVPIIIHILNNLIATIVILLAINV